MLSKTVVKINKVIFGFPPIFFIIETRYDCEGEAQEPPPTETYFRISIFRVAVKSPAVSV